jgi:peptide/nickel transport system substrate-binding protein
MPRAVALRLLTTALAAVLSVSAVIRSLGPATAAVQDVRVSRPAVGRYGGQIVLQQRAEARTLNPVTVSDISSRDVIRRTVGDLIHINRETQQPQAALAKAWTVSPDGRRYTLTLRQGVRFSDGDAFDADDVVFSFRVYLDERVNSPQRQTMIAGGKPIVVEKIDQYTVAVTLAEPYSGAERLFDSLAMLPRHLLEKIYGEGRLADAWTLTTPPAQIAGLGPFRFREYAPGERIVLERNPYYWKVDRAGNRLPYLERLVFTPVASEETQALRFQSGEADIATRMTAATFAVLSKAGESAPYELFDLGASLDHNFVFFNLNDVDAASLREVARKQTWFRQVAFRRAVSAAIDRDAIVRLVYRGRATPIWGHVSPGNKAWFNRSIPRPARSLDTARRLLRTAGFSWRPDGALVDASGSVVEFTILTGAGNVERAQMATIVQDDLAQVGMRVQVVTLDLRAVLDRLLKTHDYEASLLGLGGADGDPNGELNLLLSSGPTHLWHPEQDRPATPWEAEIDTQMRRQITTLDPAARKKLYDRVQALMAENLPLIPLVSPNVLVGARKGLGNFRPTVLDDQTLWNAEELFWRPPQAGGAR